MASYEAKIGGVIWPKIDSSHLSSTEIADVLFISANTVRSHIKSIYGKLNVHHRDAALERAKEMGLL